MGRRSGKNRSQEDTFFEIYELVEARLNYVGEIRTNDAWIICRHKTYVAYPTISGIFKQIMTSMAEQGKAIKTGNGKWNIIKPNQKKV